MHAAQDASLTDLVGQLATDVKETAQAEIGLVRARVSTKLGEFRTAAIYFAVAGVLALAALIALLVGLILALTPSVGPGFATLIVIGVTLAIAVILSLFGRSALTPGPAK